MSAPTIVSEPDVRSSDLALGGLVAAGVLLSMAALLVEAGVRADATELPEESAIAVAVTPVEREGGQASNRAEPVARADRAAVPEPAPAIDPPEPVAAIASDEPLRRHELRSQPRAEAIPSAATEAPTETPPSAAATPAEPSTPSSTETADTGDAIAGSQDGSDDGEALVDAYRATLRRWLAARVRIAGTGLDATDLDDKRVHLTLEIDASHTILGAAIEPTGTAAFDRAAQQALAALEGQILPAPPDGYPGPLQRRIPVVFVCKPGACD